MNAAEALGLNSNTRIAYTSDHGESYGNHGQFGKCQLLETAAAVPLIIAGPGVPVGQVVSEVVSQVDLFPTIIESVGAAPNPEDSSLPGESLWPAIKGSHRDRIGFGEYHAGCSRSGSYFLRRGNDKLIYHAGMPRQLFDLDADPHELNDRLASTPDAPAIKLADELEACLREICDPEAVDAQAKSDQHARVETFGGNDAIRAMGSFTRTPPPGAALIMHGSSESD
jgi:choline-sulfatase